MIVSNSRIKDVGSLLIGASFVGISKADLEIWMAHNGTNSIIENKTVDGRATFFSEHNVSEAGALAKDSRHWRQCHCHIY